MASRHSALTGRRLDSEDYDTDRNPSCRHDRCIGRSVGKERAADVIAGRTLCKSALRRRESRCLLVPAAAGRKNAFPKEEPRAISQSHPG